MGILDSNFDPNTLGGNQLLQMGLGILANNQGHGGAFAPAFGGGVQQGLQNASAYQQQQMHNKLYEMQVNKYKADLKKEEDLAAYMKTYGTPNSSFQTTANVPAPQGTDAPNFATVLETKTTPTFDKQKFMNGAMPFLDAKDSLAMLTKQDKNTWQDGGDVLFQINEQGQPTGLTMPKGASADAKLPYMYSTVADKLKYTTPTANTVYESTHQSADNKATNDAKKATTDLTDFFKTPVQPDTPTPAKLPKSKLFKLDGGGSISGTLDPVSGRYYTVKNGVKKWIKE